jgi:hypothetical protein
MDKCQKGLMGAILLLIAFWLTRQLVQHVCDYTPTGQHIGLLSKHMKTRADARNAEDIGQVEKETGIERPDHRDKARTAQQ